MTDQTTEELLREQLRLARKADRRGGCLWNIVMVLLFGVFYLAYMLVKQLVKLVIWTGRTLLRFMRWIGAATLVLGRRLLGRPHAGGDT